MRTFEEEHRRIEALLDELSRAPENVTQFRAAYTALARHYGVEDAWLRELRPRIPKAAGKMLDQHAEVVELAQAAEDSFAKGHASDGLALIRRFLALAQHNIIEEERDVFPRVE